MESIKREMVLVNPDRSEIVLSDDQASYVEFSSSSTSLVMKGVAGSGKSLVLMSKIVRLLNFHAELPSNYILLVSYTNSLVSYAKEYLDPDGSKKDSIRISTLDSVIGDIYGSMTRFNDRPRGTRVRDEERNKFLVQVLDKLSRNSSHRFYRQENRAKTVAFLSEEFEWMMGRNISNKFIYLNDPRKGRKSHLNAADRTEVFKIFIEYTDVLRKNHMYERGMVHQFVRRHLEDIPGKFRYMYVMVDEAQDFPIVDMEIVRALSKKPVTVAMDANQRLYSNYWTFKEIGVVPYSRELNKSFRCTVQIDRFADVLRRNNTGVTKEEGCDHVEPERSGDMPLVIRVKDRNDQVSAVIWIIEALQGSKGNTAILVPRKRDVLSWAKILSESGIRFEKIMGSDYVRNYKTRSPGVKICTVHSAKGLEFGNVIIPSFMNGHFPLHMPKDADGTLFDERSKEEWENSFRSLAYVAMTRAMNRLFVLYYNEPSMFLDEIDRESGGRPDVGRSNDLYTFLTSDYLGSSHQSPDSQDKGSKKVTEPERVEPMIYTRGAGALDGQTAERLQDDYRNRIEALRSVQGVNHEIPEDSYLRVDPERNVALLREMADRGCVEAQYNLALCLYHGVGTKRNRDAALKLLFKADDAGSAEARDMIATREFRWEANPGMLLKAATYGNASARSVLADELSDKNDSAAFLLAEEDYNAGNVKALYDLGWMSEMGRGGVKKQSFGYAKHCYRTYYERTGEERGKNGLERLKDVEESSERPELFPLSEKYRCLFEEADPPSGGGDGDHTGEDSVPADGPAGQTEAVDDIVSFLLKNNITYRDNRGEGKNLWIRGGRELESKALELSSIGVRLKGNPSRKEMSESKWFRVES